MMRRLGVPTLSLAVVLAACGSGRTAQTASDSAMVPAGKSAQPAGGMPGMGGMSGMSGMSGMQGGDMMAQMQAHMDTVMNASADRAKAMLPMHRQMVANMLAQMNQQMRSMNMAADAAWTATVDSLRQDLVRMPEMRPAELKAAMPAHQARIMRLMEMHRSMMGAMQK